MKKRYLIALLALGACNAMGIGKNDTISIYNNSSDVITANTDRGSIRINPQTSSIVKAKDFAQINSTNTNCNSHAVPTETNVAAVVLDIIPGFFLGIIPLVVDAIVGFDEMPKSFYYSC